MQNEKINKEIDMFRKMRREIKEMSENENNDILNNGIYGVMSVTGDDSYPYGVPMNYAYEDGVIYMHSATMGHKLDAILSSDKVCFTVVDQVKVIPEKLSTAFKSVIVFGKVEIIPEDDVSERQKAFEAICFKYCPKDEKTIMCINKSAPNGKHAAIIKIIPEHISGKASLAE